MREITMQDLRSLFFKNRKGHLFMLGTAYLDESADPANSTVFVSAGFYCVDPHWKILRREWRRVLKSHGISFFRSYDCRTLKGEFAKLKTKWGDEKARVVADKIRANLIHVLEDTSPLLMGAGFGLNMKDFLEVDAMPEARQNQQWMRECHDYQTCAYRNAFNLLSHLLIVEMKSVENYIAFVCDESTHYRKIKRGYERMKIKFPILADRFVSLARMDDKKIPELQMADLMADGTREMITKYLSQGNEQEVPPSCMRGRVVRVQTWNKNGMLKFLRGEAVGA